MTEIFLFWLTGSVHGFDVISYPGGRVIIDFKNRTNITSPYFCKFKAETECKDLLRAQVSEIIKVIHKDRISLLYTGGLITLIYRNLSLQDTGMYQFGDLNWNHTINLKVNSGEKILGALIFKLHHDRGCKQQVLNTNSCVLKWRVLICFNRNINQVKWNNVVVIMYECNNEITWLTDPCCSGTKAVTGHLGQTLMISCFYPVEFETNPKSFYRLDGFIEAELIRTSGTEQHQDGRFSISDDRKNKVFSVNITNLRENDGGLYSCAVTEDMSSFSYQSLFTVIQLQATGEIYFTTILQWIIKKTPQLKIVSLSGTMTLTAAYHLLFTDNTVYNQQQSHFHLFGNLVFMSVNSLNPQSSEQSTVRVMTYLCFLCVINVWTWDYFLVPVNRSNKRHSRESRWQIRHIWVW